MLYRILLLILVIGIFVSNCTKKPEIIIDEQIDYSYDQLKQQYYTCKGKGVMSARGILPWKMNYSFTTQNDSSYLQFKDVFGRRVLFIQAFPDRIILWDMLKDVQYNSKMNTSIPIFDILESNDIAQILWGEIPYKFQNINQESGFESDSNLVNFESATSQIGMVLEKVIFNIDSLDTKVVFTISERAYGESIPTLLNGIPKDTPWY